MEKKKCTSHPTTIMSGPFNPWFLKQPSHTARFPQLFPLPHEIFPCLSLGLVFFFFLTLADVHQSIRHGHQLFPMEWILHQFKCAKRYIYEKFMHMFFNIVLYFFSQLPGRQNRIDETPISDPKVIVEKLTEQIYPLVKDTPYLFFGYSMGGDIAMLVADVLTKRYKLPPVAMLFGATPALHTV